LDGSVLIVNADQIEFIESTPDTVISLISNKKLVVREPADNVVEQIQAYKRRVLGQVTIQPGNE